MRKGSFAFPDARGTESSLGLSNPGTPLLNTSAQPGASSRLWADNVRPREVKYGFAAIAVAFLMARAYRM